MTSSAASASTVMTQEQDWPTRLFTRSTIYHRHEKRRAKTLQNAHDTRPAHLRILAQLAAAAPSNPTQMAQSESTNNNNMSKESHFLPDDDHSTVFRTHIDSSSSTTNTAVSKTNPLTVAVSAAMGAKLHQVVSSRSSSSPSTNSTLSTTSAAAQSSARIVWQGESLALSLPQQQQHTAAVANNNSGKTLAAAARRNPMRPISTITPSSTNLQQSSLLSLSWNRVMSSPMTPCFVLFGTKAWVESQLLSSSHNNNNQHAAPISWASLTASGMAGAVTGLCRRTNIGGEASAAILYFGSYDLIKAALLGRDYYHYDSQQQQQPLGTTTGSPWHVAAIATAGATAGSLYEVLRVYGTSAPLLLSCQRGAAFAPRALAMTPIVMRAAPAHATLFLGLEAAQSVLQSTMTAN